jgi:hypothetical protein
MPSQAASDAGTAQTPQQPSTGLQPSSKQ